MSKRTRDLLELAAITELFKVQNPTRACFYDRLHRVILREARRDQSNDARSILSAIDKGVSTAADIAKNTGIPWVTVQAHLRQLLVQRLVIRRKAPNDSRGSGGDRRTYLYWPRE